mgnify:CR=1 FL=1
MRVDALQKTDKVGNLPVVFAVRNGAKLELVQFMYEHNIAKSREWTDSYGWNLLFHAVHKNRHSLVPYLLFMGGENYHKNHHDNPGELVMGKWDTTGKYLVPWLLAK